MSFFSSKILSRFPIAFNYYFLCPSPSLKKSVCLFIKFYVYFIYSGYKSLLDIRFEIFFLNSVAYLYLLNVKFDEQMFKILMLIYQYFCNGYYFLCPI